MSWTNLKICGGGGRWAVCGPPSDGHRTTSNIQPLVWLALILSHSLQQRLRGTRLNSGQGFHLHAFFFDISSCSITKLSIILVNATVSPHWSSNPSSGPIFHHALYIMWACVLRRHYPRFPNFVYMFHLSERHMFLCILEMLNQKQRIQLIVSKSQLCVDCWWQVVFRIQTSKIRGQYGPQ